MDIRNNSYKQDKRKAFEIRQEMQELARSYTPEWEFDTAKPDIGSVIGMIFADQMEENIRKWNMVTEKYRTELINLFGISVRPAQPANAVVILEVMKEAAEGIDLPKGTRFLGNTEGGEKESVVFESVHALHAVKQSPSELLAVSERNGKIKYYSKKEEETEYPIRLFDFSSAGQPESCLEIYHSYLFDSEGDEIHLIFEGERTGIEYAQLFTDPEEYCFLYPGQEGNMPFDKVLYIGDKVVLQRSQKSEGSKIYLKKLKHTKEALGLSDIRIGISGRTAKPEFISDGNSEFGEGKIACFGEELSVYNECYIGQEQAFSKKGAEITLCFQWCLSEKEYYLTPKWEEEELKIFKRKKNTVLKEKAAECYISEISIEYYSGKGWRRLPCRDLDSGIFDGRSEKGSGRLSFTCPEDWESLNVSGYEKKCLRFRITKAEGCYMRPAKHFYPLIWDMEISYHFPDIQMRPEQLSRRFGKKQEILTKQLLEKKGFIAFEAFPYKGEAFLIGFDEKLAGAPVSIYFLLRYQANQKPVPVKYEYSSQQGFKTLKVYDRTEQMTSAGTLLFVPPSDMEKIEIEGNSRYWIKISSLKELEKEEHLPLLEQLYMNGVEIRNIETEEMQDYYIDAPAPNMKFPVYADNILDAEVWVNESTQSESEKFIKWQETESFDLSEAGDRHYILDRTNKQIIFGDGVSAKIPAEIRNTAFRIGVKRCDGKIANVRTGAITSAKNLLFLERVFNPLPAYAGSDMETEEDALERGSNRLSNSKRLVSERDYIRETKAFSSEIDKVKCCPEGRRLRIIILMKDFEGSSSSFRQLKGKLQAHLLKHSAATYDKNEIVIEEPVFVKISVEVWIVLENPNMVFEIRDTILNRIRQFLEPLSDCASGGWEIGKVPKESQIQMLLNSFSNGFYIKNYVITTSYVEGTKLRETDLNEASENPFAVCMNGTHKIHIMERRR